MKEAMYYKVKEDYIHCYLCPHHCKIQEGNVGICGVRKVINNTLYTLNYGKISVIHIDPIEKKPIVNWNPGTEILSFGTFGCNFKCGYCQNYKISMEKPWTREISPEEIVEEAIEKGVPSIAYTYNEPTIFYEMMWDVAVLAKKRGLNNVMVTNGFIEKEPFLQIVEYMDAVNIDLKTYSDDTYKLLGGKTLEKILETIEIATSKTHVEISLLIVPGISDEIDKIEGLFQRLSNIDEDLTLHIARYFPMYKYNENPTDIKALIEIQNKATEYFKHVYLGNVR
jgi:pyruvate formate lyase activating enzyme